MNTKDNVKGFAGLITLAHDPEEIKKGRIPEGSTKKSSEDRDKKSPGTSLWVWAFIVIWLILILMSIIFTESKNSSDRDTDWRGKSSQNVKSNSMSHAAYKEPSVGTGNIFSVSEIRWCLREGIRLKTMRDIVNSSRGITVFNTYVENYNRRCGNYRYRQSSMSVARRHIDEQRLEIILEARQMANEMNK